MSQTLSRIAIVCGIAFLAACATGPTETIDPLNPIESIPPSTSTDKALPPAKDPERSTPSRDEEPDARLISMLGMRREASELGFAEKAYDPCEYHADAGAACGARYVTVVNFQLLCRDGEGSAQDVPARLEPISSPLVTWQVAGRSGPSPTDAGGYGHFVLSGGKALAGERLILHIGPQFVGLDVSEVNKVVLPANYCRPK